MLGPEDEGVRIEEVDDAEAERIESGTTAEEAQRLDLEGQCSAIRAVLWANMAAVYLKLVRSMSRRATNCMLTSRPDAVTYTGAEQRGCRVVYGR